MKRVWWEGGLWARIVTIGKDGTYLDFTLRFGLYDKIKSIDRAQGWRLNREKEGLFR